MRVTPIIENNICRNAHPEGSKAYVAQLINWVRENKPQSSTNRFPKRVLVIGGSTGYGLGSRIVSAFAGDAATICISFERAPTLETLGSPGWYQSEQFDNLAHQQGLTSVTIYGDAFSTETKHAVSKKITDIFGQVDLVVYSIAAPKRTVDDKIYRSVIKPIGCSFTGASFDIESGKLFDFTIESATDDEIVQTVKVMGGEDWFDWICFLADKNLLAKNAMTVAFSYVGPEFLYPIYRDGTIGKAKENLELTSKAITNSMKDLNIRAVTSTNKAVVTRASFVIPQFPLYLAALYHVMKKAGLHENPTAQMLRLFDEHLYAGKELRTPIRLDDRELQQEIQQQVQQVLLLVEKNKSMEFIDLEDFRKEFLQIHGFSMID